MSSCATQGCRSHHDLLLPDGIHPEHRANAEHDEHEEEHEQEYEHEHELYRGTRPQPSLVMPQTSSVDGAEALQGHVCSLSSRPADLRPSKWKVVRPWQPPVNDEDAAVAHLENGLAELAGESGTDYEDEDEEYDLHHDHDPEEDCFQAERYDFASCTAGSSGRTPTPRGSFESKRLQLEVVDVGSTSVSLSLFEQSQNTGERHSTTSSGSSPVVLPSEPAADSLPTPNISIKLNSASWPHVLHSDAFLPDTERTEASQEPNEPSGSSILVWGLSPGVDYHIELGVFEGDEPDDEEEELEETYEESDLADSEAHLSASASAAATPRNLDLEPDVPPPPYSSHDPSLPSSEQRDTEGALRHMLETLRLQSRQAENHLQSSISAMRRANDKLIREDQRQRQRIHMLEDSTARLQEVACHEKAESEDINSSILELEDAEKEMVQRNEYRKEYIERLEKITREESDRDEAELLELHERLETIMAREDVVLAKKLRLERELLPTYNIQLATLEADVRRMLDDQRRSYLSGGASSHHALYSLGFGSHLNGPSTSNPTTNTRSASVRHSTRGASLSSAQSTQPTAQEEFLAYPASHVLGRAFAASRTEPSPPPMMTNDNTEITSDAPMPDEGVGVSGTRELDGHAKLMGRTPPASLINARSADWRSPATGVRRRSASLGRAEDRQAGRGVAETPSSQVQSVKEDCDGARDGRQARASSRGSTHSPPSLRDESAVKDTATLSSRFSWASKVVAGAGYGGKGSSKTRKASGTSD